jgi:hypothetical protein
MGTLPGFIEVPLWIVVTLYIIGITLLYFGAMGRGRARITTILIGLVVVGYTFYPNVDGFLADHPGIRTCIVAMWTSMSASCPALH